MENLPGPPDLPDGRRSGGDEGLGSRLQRTCDHTRSRHAPMDTHQFCSTSMQGPPNKKTLTGELSSFPQPCIAWPSAQPAPCKLVRTGLPCAGWRRSRPQQCESSTRQWTAEERDVDPSRLLLRSAVQGRPPVRTWSFSSARKRRQHWASPKGDWPSTHG